MTEILGILIRFGCEALPGFDTADSTALTRAGAAATWVRLESGAARPADGNAVQKKSAAEARTV